MRAEFTEHAVITILYDPESDVGSRKEHRPGPNHAKRVSRRQVTLDIPRSKPERSDQEKTKNN